MAARQFMHTWESFMTRRIDQGFWWEVSCVQINKLRFSDFEFNGFWILNLTVFLNKPKSIVAISAAAFVFGIFCLCLPLLAFSVLNSEWQLYIPVIDVNYKPWRLFIAVCGSLSAICGICFFFLPESPKFIFASVSLISGKFMNTWSSLLNLFSRVTKNKLWRFLWKCIELTIERLRISMLSRF